jgi:hypothetical protein
MPTLTPIRPDDNSNHSLELGVAYLEKRGVLFETFQAHGGEILSTSSNNWNLIADRLSSAVKDENLLGNRAGDNWRSMFAIAREAGEEWLKKSIQAAERMQRRTGQDSWSFNQSLIAALEEFMNKRRERLGLAVTENFFVPTGEILFELNNDKEAPWYDPKEAKDGLTAHRLGKELRAYEVESKVGDVGGATRKTRKQLNGYWSEDLEKATKKYSKSAKPQK